MELENEPTKIVYKPCCGNCGAPINGTVTYYGVYKKTCELMLPNKVCTEVFPYVCTNCGAPFNSVEITPPENLGNIILEEGTKWGL